MNVNIKQKLAGKSAYIALGLLLLMILVFTVIAIVAAVNTKDGAVEPPISENQPNGDNGDQPGSDTPTGGDDINDPSEPTGGEDQPGGDTPTGTEPEDDLVYSLPCEGYVQKDYSEDVLVFSQTMNDHRIHLGVDISGKIGDPVKAFAKGTVEKIFNDKFMGKTVIIDHGNGLRSVYMNLGAEIPSQIKEGAKVEAGEVIGAIGESAITECADSPHLHFEIRLDTKKVDPKKYVTIPSSASPDEEYEG